MKKICDAITLLNSAMENPADKKLKHAANVAAFAVGIGGCNLDDFQDRLASYRLTEGAAVVALRQVAERALSVLNNRGN